MAKEETVQLGLIAVVLGGAIYVLSKSGIFGLAKKTTDVAGKIVDEAGKIVENTVELPANIVTLVGYVPGLIQATGAKLGFNTYGINSATVRAQNIMNNLAQRFPGLSGYDLVQASVNAGLKFDESGNIIEPGGASGTGGTGAPAGGGTQYQVEIQIEPPGGGKVRIGSYDVTVAQTFDTPAGIVRLIATPFSGYVFDHWGGWQQLGTYPDISVSISGPAWIVAVFRVAGTLPSPIYGPGNPPPDVEY